MPEVVTPETPDTPIVEVKGGIEVVDTVDDLPVIGESDMLYKVLANEKIYTWNVSTGTYTAIESMLFLISDVFMNPVFRQTVRFHTGEELCRPFTGFFFGFGCSESTESLLVPQMLTQKLHCLCIVLYSGIVYLVADAHSPFQVVILKRFEVYPSLCYKCRRLCSAHSTFLIL